MVRPRDGRVRRVRLRLLDLFCKAGGTSVGYHRSGFDVVGVDIEPQPNYPFPFIQGDALDVLRRLIAGEGITASDGRTYYLHDFDGIAASPPCQAYSDMKSMPNAKEHPRLIEPVRELLREIGKPYVIENVARAPLHHPVMLCGAAFGLGSEGLDLARHRYFEADFFIMAAPCSHGARRVIGLYGDHARTDRRSTRVGHGQLNAADSLRRGREAMGIEWMTWDELTQAIPPAYTEHIGHYLLAEINARRSPGAAVHSA